MARRSPKGCLDRWGASGLRLVAQRAAAASFVAGRSELAAEFIEIEGGQRSDRPELHAAIAACSGTVRRAYSVRCTARAARAFRAARNLRRISSNNA